MGRILRDDAFEAQLMLFSMNDYSKGKCFYIISYKKKKTIHNSNRADFRRLVYLTIKKFIFVFCFLEWPGLSSGLLDIKEYAVDLCNTG